MPTSRTGRPDPTVWQPGRGFTIVELLVVIVLISVLSGMVALRLGSLNEGRRLREDARQLQATAQYAREYAATRRMPCRLMLDAEQGRFSLACLGADEKAGEFVPVPGWAGRAVSLGKGVRFGQLNISPRPDGADYGQRSHTDGSANCVTFTPEGLADAAVVPVTDGRKTYSLLISPAGQLRLVAEAVNKLPNDRIDLDD
jgi:type II secretion system protein H